MKLIDDRNKTLKANNEALKVNVRFDNTRSIHIKTK